ncbi:MULTISPECIES: NUDIX domain-containing protein [unclassified Neochlamydia]|uniref:NUDIX domain-containing protein n=1 Tax=unclassified Neochlamydia TaxID=2643326 RepID=UPI001408CFAF|nr:MULTISPECIES: NUDIX domain-containing protein [unclassified Neochlamydia]
MNQIIRHGAYGVIFQDSQILLTQKQSGPYEGLWGLPGGAIEFGETPEAALRRELLEEASIAISKLEFLSIVTSTGHYANNGVLYGFHQVGLLYKILGWEKQPGLVPQEENRWVKLTDILQKELTPFALHAIFNLPTSETWRPHNSIRGKVIGLAKHENQLLVCEVLNGDGLLKGWCPIGGSIKFGESAEEALKREIYKKLGCNLVITGEPIVCENIFEHQGIKRHEIIFTFPIKLSNETIYTKNRFQLYEDRRGAHWVEWIPIDRFERSEALLFPSIIVDKIAEI